MSSTSQLALIARRSVSRTFRQPVLVVPVIAFPLILLAVNAAGLSSVTELPGFPTKSYINFAIVVCFVQGALFAAISAGTELASDIQTGFTDRLALTPAKRWVVLAGATAGGASIAVFGSVIYLVVGLIFGVEIDTGVVGALVLLALAIYTAIAFAGIGAWLAVATGSPQAVQGMFPLLFVLLFLSTMSLPLDFIQKEWFATIVEWNPLTYLIDGMRGLVIGGWDASTLLPAITVATGIMVITFTGASRSLRKRVQRT
ncbi:MAG: ABC transporter permease [Solirubrobacterales bacterium]|nr:ABC transporter permease [Solirubrobacterales bacterium]